MPRSAIGGKFIEGLLRATAASSVRKLNLHTHTYEDVITTVENWVYLGYPISSIVINIIFSILTLKHMQCINY